MRKKYVGGLARRNLPHAIGDGTKWGTVLCSSDIAWYSPSSWARPSSVAKHCTTLISVNAIYSSPLAKAWEAAWSHLEEKPNRRTLFCHCIDACSGGPSRGSKAVCRDDSRPWRQCYMACQYHVRFCYWQTYPRVQHHPEGSYHQAYSARRLLAQDRVPCVFPLGPALLCRMLEQPTLCCNQYINGWGSLERAMGVSLERLCWSFLPLARRWQPCLIANSSSSGKVVPSCTHQSPPRPLRGPDSCISA